MAGALPSHAAARPEPARGLWLSALKLTDFRNYDALSLALDARPVVLTGANGAGKTNLLEAVSFLVPGRGLRRATLSEAAREDAPNAPDTSGGWAVWARLEGSGEPLGIGTGLRREADGAGASDRREIRIEGEKVRGTGQLAAACRMIWLTPAMDQLFTGPASARRQFLDGLVLAADPRHRSRVNAFDNAMRQRNALLDKPRPDAHWLNAIEAQMAEHAAAIAAARLDTVRLLQGVINARPEGPFPKAQLSLHGEVEGDLARMAAVDAEDRYRASLAAARPSDAAAGRTLCGPHRCDILVLHAAHGRAAARCSTGEQKILLLGLILAHGALVRDLMDGLAPLVLLDEVAAHLDTRHRAALFAELGALGAQAWMTGTDAALFDELGDRAQHLRVADGGVVPLVH